MIAEIRREYERILSALVNPETGEPLCAYPDGYALDRDEGDGSPKPAEYPYLTYTLGRGELLTTDYWTLKPWTRYQTTDIVDAICGQIERLIPAEGVMIALSSGGIWLHRADPFIQPLPQEDQMLRAALVTIEARFYVA